MFQYNSKIIVELLLFVTCNIQVKVISSGETGVVSGGKLFSTGGVVFARATTVFLGSIYIVHFSPTP